MPRNHDYADPIRFDKIANDDGIVDFTTTTSTGGDDRFEVGRIFIRTERPCEGQERDFQVYVQELIVRGERLKHEAYVNLDNLPKHKLVKIATHPVRFADCDPCVPGYHTDCKKNWQVGHPPPDPKVVAANFWVRAVIGKYPIGERVAGYLFLEIKTPTAA